MLQFLKKKLFEEFSNCNFLMLALLQILVLEKIFVNNPDSGITTCDLAQRLEQRTRLWVIKLSRQGFLRVVASHAVVTNVKTTNFYYPREVALEALVRKNLSTKQRF